jgi:hypothetical protein
MLIRSQDKTIIVNFNNICTVSAFPEKDSEDIYVEDGTGSLMVGRYSTKAKAMKVLDMIREAYMEYKSGEIVGNGLAGSAYTGSYDTKESVAHGIAVLKGYGNEIRKSILFQMPEDSEVVA